MFRKILATGAFVVGFSIAYVATPAFAQAGGDDEFDPGLGSGLDGIQSIFVEEIISRIECDEDKVEREVKRAYKGLKPSAKYFRERVRRSELLAAVEEQMELLCDDEGGEDDIGDGEDGMDPGPGDGGEGGGDPGPQ